jgi:23S rRNA (pseudouridine1915-N3)-methyltransferase
LNQPDFSSQYNPAMRLHLVTVGSPKLEYARTGCELYETRLSRFHKLKVTRVRDSKRSGEAAKQEEGERILEVIGSAFLIALDLKGKMLDTVGLAQALEKLGVDGHGEIAFVIGGDEGLSDAVRAKAGLLWKLSDLTFPHDLAQLVTLEALYRASTVSAGVPYHK